MKKFLIGAAILASLAAGAVQAQPVPADRAVKYRQSALTVMSTSFGRIGAHIKGDAKLDALSSLARALVESRGVVPADALDSVRRAGYTDAQVIEMMRYLMQRLKIIVEPACCRRCPPTR